jgi:hypothetical protein
MTAVPKNRTFYTIPGTDFWTYDKAEADAYVRAANEEGYNLSYETYTEAEAYGAEHDPKMFTNPEARRAPKPGRRYRLLRR